MARRARLGPATSLDRVGDADRQPYDLYVLGVAWLAVFLVGLRNALIQGMVIFVHGDLIKIVIAALTLPGGRVLVHKGQDRHRLE